MRYFDGILPDHYPGLASFAAVPTCVSESHATVSTVQASSLPMVPSTRGLQTYYEAARDSTQCGVSVQTCAYWDADFGLEIFMIDFHFEISNARALSKIAIASMTSMMHNLD